MVTVESIISLHFEQAPHYVPNPPGHSDPLHHSDPPPGLPDASCCSDVPGHSGWHFSRERLLIGGCGHSHVSLKYG